MSRVKFKRTPNKSQEIGRINFSVETKNYIVRLLKQYYQEKLTEGEEIQLFQDLADSGLGWQMGSDLAEMTNYFIAAKVIKPPPSGFIPPPIKFSQMILRKKVLAN